MKISIVFSVFNNSSYTKQCLDKLFEIVDLNIFSIIVVNDGSTDGTNEILKLYDKKIYVLNGDGKFFWSKSMNIGLEYAFSILNSDFVTCWNNDILCRSDYFDNLINIVSKHNIKNTLIGSKVFYLEPNDLIFTYGCYFNNLNGKSLFNGNLKYDSIEFATPLNVDWCGGMGLTIPKEAYKVVGNFDNYNFPQYKADSDFCLRAKYVEINLVCYPDLIIYNDVCNSGLGEYSQSLKDFLRSFTAINSTMNIINNIKFIYKHCKGLFGYFYFFYTLIKYIIKYFYLKSKNFIGL